MSPVETVAVLAIVVVVAAVVGSVAAVPRFAVQECWR